MALGAVAQGLDPVPVLDQLKLVVKGLGLEQVLGRCVPPTEVNAHRALLQPPQLRSISAWAVSRYPQHLRSLDSERVLALLLENCRPERASEAVAACCSALASLCEEKDNPWDSAGILEAMKALLNRDGPRGIACDVVATVAEVAVLWCLCACRWGVRSVRCAGVGLATVPVVLCGVWGG